MGFVVPSLPVCLLHMTPPELASARRWTPTGTGVISQQSAARVQVASGATVHLN